MPNRKSKIVNRKSRKPGAQKGNKNALRHGFYSRRYTTDEKTRLEATESIDVQSEIALLRVCMDRLAEQLDFEKYKVKDSNGNTLTDDHYLKQLNTLSIMTGSLSTLTRTHYLIRGKAGDVNDSIMRALEELRLEMGL